MDRMKSVYIFLWNLRIGGVQKMSILTANALAEKGFTVTLVCGDPNGDLATLISEKVKIERFTIKKTNNPINLIGQLKALLKLIPKRAVIFASGSNNFRQLARINTIFQCWNIIFILHNDLPLKGQIKSRIGYLEVKALCKSKRLHIVALSKKQRDLHQNSYNPTNLSIIPNFIDFNHSHLREKFQEGQVKAVSVGRYADQKGYDILLEAMKRVENVHVDVYGVGDSERIRLTKLAIEEGVSNISFKSSVKSAIAMMSLYDFFILPSRYEPFGLVLVEALSAGLPVLTTDCDGPKEIITHNENGFFVAKKNSHALAEGIKIMSEKTIKGEFDPHGMRNSASHFDIEEILKRYWEIID